MHGAAATALRLMGLTERSTYLPADLARSIARARYLSQARAALLPLQSDDGSWREVVDEPTSYRELTVTAMTVTAMARGRSAWLAAGDVRTAIDKGWLAVVARVNQDGTVRDVCSSTGAGPTKEYLPESSGRERRRRSRRCDGAAGAIEIERGSRASERCKKSPNHGWRSLGLAQRGHRIDAAARRAGRYPASAAAVPSVTPQSRPSSRRWRPARRAAC